MSFDFFSLDYIYYPVSGIMWVWHKAFGLVLGNNNPWSWVLSVVFLVFTLRGLLFKPFMKQMNSQMKMQAVAPELKKLREKYKDDKTRLAEEMQKFNKEAGVNPLGGCLPALVQAPVFIGLFHVLRSFKPGWGQVYFFGKADVQSFVEAKLFGGAPLSSYMTMPWESTARQVGLGPDGLNGNRATVIAISIPIIVLAAIATHLTSRRSVARQKQLQIDQSANPQSAIMNKVMLYVFPLGVLATGPFFPLAIIIYYLSNNTWTFGQLYVAHRIQDKKIEAESMVIDEAKEAAKFSKPLPGAKPVAKPAVPGEKPVSTRPAPGARPQPGVKPAPGAKPVAGSKQTAGTKRRVVQPSSKSAGAPSNTAANPSPNGSSAGSTNGSKAPAGSGNGSAGSAAPVASAAAGPSLTKTTTGSLSANGSNGSTAGASASNGSSLSNQKPSQPTVKKKKPGRR